MTTIKTTVSRQHSGSASLAFAARQVARALAAAWKVYRNRQQMKALRDLDDYLLADIGLTRADVEQAAATMPIFTDPTARLTIAASSDFAPTVHPRGRRRETHPGRAGSLYG
ncbi:MAG TPA: DUF1127 domain-containing protein [Methylomirabilota bacterium]|nr:DUF1127 domain-containing protein [Methylomirabilota bacterium]